MRLLFAVAVVIAAVAATATTAAPARAAASHALIQGSGSSWSANAMNQWIADVQSNGLQVVFTASGSAQGRKDFGYRTSDFAVTEIGYQGTDPVTGDSDTSQGRAFAYLPIVSGGTAFPYQVRVRGQLVRNLRLSGRTLALIFTNHITNWNDPAITADNNGQALPSLPIIPVVHSEGSGSSAHFTDYMDKLFPDIWRPFSGHAGLTEYYPRQGSAIAQSGSDGVMNFVASAAANGAIGYDEYSYALGKNYPVAKIGNAAGYFTLPSQFNVAVALTRAVINQDQSSQNYLLQDLSQVYVYNDARTYPLSSYSYMVEPTAPDDSKMTTAKRQTLADFLYYSICDGQKEMGPIGYSPLPINLVQAGFQQIGKLHQADPGVDLSQRDVSTCNNPTFIAGQPNRNYLAEIAPMPPPCDQSGQGPCTDAAAGRGDALTAAIAKGGAAAAARLGSGAGGPGATGAAGAAGAAAGGPNASTAAAAATDAALHPGDALAVGLGARSGSADIPGHVSPSGDSLLTKVLMGLAAALLLAVLVAPTLLVRRFARRRAAA
ncbi:MAG: substrate-binding domain-containing protein [Acidimicrobiia bacterium]|nr:substrate-binding domain-containing protein [Acidimicrobiia bacterium]